MFTSTKKYMLDRVGMFTSIACAIHCAVLPFVITLLPLVGLEFVGNSLFELLMIGLAVAIGSYSMLKSYRTHKDARPSLLLIAGFAIIACGHLLSESVEFVLIPIGGLCIAAAHYLNLRIHMAFGCKHQQDDGHDKL